MSELSRQKETIESAMKHAKSLKIVNIIFYSVMGAILMLFLLLLASGGNKTGVIIAVVLMFFLLIGLLVLEILWTVFTITTLIKVSSISNKFSKGISSSGGILLIVGIFVPFASIIGSIVISKEIKESLESFEKSRNEVALEQ